MVDYLFYIFIGGFLITVFELLLLDSWNGWYFRNGIPVYRKNYILPKGMNLLAQPIKAKWIPDDDFQADLVFQDIGKDEVAFREEITYKIKFGFRYTPIMHGLIRRNSTLNGIEVVGFLNWSAITVGLAFLSGGIAIMPCGIIFLLVVAVMLFVCYRIQAQRFDEIGLIFDEVKETKTSR